MKRKILTFILSMSLVASHAIPAFAESLNDSESVMVVEETGELDENSGTIVGADETISFEANDGDIIEENEILVETESIPSSDETEYSSPLDTNAESSEKLDDSNSEETETADDENFIDSDIIDDSIEIETLEEEGTVDEGTSLAANSSSSTALSINANTFYSEALTKASEYRWYKVTIPNRGYISLTFNHDYVDTAEYRWKASLYNSDQRELVEYDYQGRTTSAQGENIGVPAGTYYVRIKSYYSSTFSNANYSIKLNYEASTAWEQEFNDTSTSANSIEVNSTVFGNLRKESDADWYRVALSQDGYISLSFNHVYVDTAESRWKASLYNSDQRELVEYEYQGRTTSAQGGNIGVPAGMYYIKIKSYYSTTFSSANYNFKLNFTSSKAWEKEFNDTYSGANSFDVNTTVYGNLRKESDADWYRITLSQNGYISFSFNHDYVDTAESRWKASLYNLDQRELVEYDYQGRTTSAQGGNIGVPAGMYYIKIKSYYSTTFSSANYNFKLNFTPSNAWETEFNDTYGTADVVDANVTVYGSLRKSEDGDYYKVHLPEGITYLEFSHGYLNTAEFRWKVYIYNSNYNTIASYDFRGNTTSVSCNLGQLSAGVYYVRVRPYSSSTYSNLDYSLKLGLHTHKYSNVVTKATTSKNGKIVKTCSCGKTNGTTTIYYPKTISLSASTYVYDGTVKNPAVTVKGSDGKTISPSNYTVSYTTGRKDVGAYNVIIKFSGNYSGTASLRFQINPRATSISNLTAKSKGFNVKWNRQTTQVSGYQIQYSTSKYFSGAVTKTITNNSTASATYKGLKAKKKYYVRIRTYKKVSGITYYSTWSSAKKVKTKK